MKLTPCHKISLQLYDVIKVYVRLLIQEYENKLFALKCSEKHSGVSLNIDEISGKNLSRQILTKQNVFSALTTTLIEHDRTWVRFKNMFLTNIIKKHH